MQLTTGPPLLIAIGLRILLNHFNTAHTPSIPDYLLLGIWQGVLLHTARRHLSLLVYPTGIGVTAKLLFDYRETSDASRCACTLFGIAVGVLLTDILAQLFEYGRYDEREPVAPYKAAHEPRRLRLVSFDRTATAGDRRRDRETRRRTPSPVRARARALAASPAPTNHTTTLTSYTVDSLPSSIDPQHRLSPLEREAAVLRSRASLADSERRRYKEERKWALSQGNKARASQLAWQVRRYTTLMESFHKEADAKVVEAARAAAQAAQSFAAPQPQVGPSRHNAVAGPSRTTRGEDLQQPRAGPSNSATNGAPLVSVTVGAPTRSRKRSGGALKPAIYIHS